MSAETYYFIAGFMTGWMLFKIIISIWKEKND